MYGYALRANRTYNDGGLKPTLRLELFDELDAVWNNLATCAAIGKCAVAMVESVSKNIAK